jgi:hypothetical protein
LTFQRLVVRQIVIWQIVIQQIVVWQIVVRQIVVQQIVRHRNVALMLTRNTVIHMVQCDQIGDISLIGIIIYPKRMIGIMVIL